MADWLPSNPWLPPNYRMQTGSGLDRPLLVKFMQQTYQELYPEHDFSHLVQTVERYFSAETPLWWVKTVDALETQDTEPSPIACLWMGNAIDQVWGDRHAYIFLLYVHPAFRRVGIGSALMRYAETWATQRGDQRIALQVFHSNQPALQLYTSLGYQPQSLWLMKSLNA